MRSSVIKFIIFTLAPVGYLVYILVSGSIPCRNKFTRERWEILRECEPKRYWRWFWILTVLTGLFIYFVLVKQCLIEN